MPASAAPGFYLNSYRLSIPNDPALIGAPFFPQWMTVYTQCGSVPPCFAGWVATSEAGIAVIGL